MTDFAVLDVILLAPATGKVGHPRIPHRCRWRAAAAAGPVTYRLVSNWPRTRWFLSASRDGFRHGWPRATSSPAIAENWLRLFSPDDLRDTVQGFTVRARDGYTTAEAQP
jgi:hypothetical protein